ncbi:MAG TPA: HAMP domain-containing sensor histidine kinase [Polyangiaceae bacterium]|jgi:signal transduction histidine kinase
MTIPADPLPAAPSSGTFLAIGPHAEWALALDELAELLASERGGERDALQSAAEALNRNGAACVLDVDGARYGAPIRSASLDAFLRRQTARASRSDKPVWWSAADGDAAQPDVAWMLNAALRAERRALGVLTAFGDRLADAAGPVLVAIEAARLLGAALGARRARHELAVAAHELKNPLAIILMTARAGTGDLETIERHATRALALVRDILDRAAIRQTRSTPGRVACAPPDLVRDAIETLAPLASAGSLRLVAAVEPDLPRVCADPRRIGQVLVNLVGNALKFTPRGGHIVVGATALESHVAFHVTDDGPGVAPDLGEKIFEPFWHGERGHGGDTGLGLSIARDIVHAHGGRLWLQSARGCGARFVFTLPRAAVKP